MTKREQAYTRWIKAIHDSPSYREAFNAGWSASLRNTALEKAIKDEETLSNTENDYDRLEALKIVGSV